MSLDVARCASLALALLAAVWSKPALAQTAPETGAEAAPEAVTEPEAATEPDAPTEPDAATEPDPEAVTPPALEPAPEAAPEDPALAAPPDEASLAPPESPFADPPAAPQDGLPPALFWGGVALTAITAATFAYFGASALSIASRERTRDPRLPPDLAGIEEAAVIADTFLSLTIVFAAGTAVLALFTDFDGAAQATPLLTLARSSPGGAAW